MQRFVLVLLLVLSASGLAQSSRPFAGGSLTFQWVNGIGLTGLMLQGGSFDLGGGFGARANVGIGLGTSYLELGADALFPLGNERLLPYAGLGVNYLSASGVNFFGLRGLAGVSYASSPEVAFFAEIAPTYYFVNVGTTFGFPLRFGANYQFR